MEISFREGRKYAGAVPLRFGNQAVGVNFVARRIVLNYRSEITHATVARRIGIGASDLPFSRRTTLTPGGLRMKMYSTRLGFLPAALILSVSTAVSAQQTPPQQAQDPYVVGRATPPL